MKKETSISRERVIQIVDLYGKAWTNQDPNILPQIFAPDAIYIERAYDTNATFKGLSAIVRYWNYQIVGKQSNVKFRHVESEMVRDVDQPNVAVVKWLAEFDNRRENRVGESSDKTYKRVRFCQMTKLIFNKNSMVCYLEEYAQSMTGPGVRWPGIGENITDEHLTARLRQEELIPQKATCNQCLSEFPSRSQLFIHLKSTQPNGEGKCVSIQQNTEESETMWVCISLGYTNSDTIEENMRQAFLALSNNDDFQFKTTTTTIDNMIWAVPPSWTSSAVVNVVSIRLSKTISIQHLPEQMNIKLQHFGIRIHTAVIVDRPCVQDRRDFEKYEAFIPWSVLQGQEQDKELYKEPETFDNNSAMGNIGKGWSKHNNHCRKPLCETDAFQYADPEMAKRLRNGARLLKDCGRADLGHFAENKNELKVRIRTSIMDNPYHHLCRISLSLMQPYDGIVERILGLLLVYACSTLSDEELISFASQVLSHDYTPPSTTLQRYVPVCLLEPALTKYEGKIGTQLCGSSNNNTAKMPKEVEGSIIKMEMSIIDNLITA